MPPEDEELELENDEDEDDAAEDDDDDVDEVVKEELLEDIIEALENLEGATEVDIDEVTADAIALTMNDDSRWKLILRRVA